MINIYKKVEKSKENHYGYVEINQLDKPFLLCIAAQDNNDQSIFGTIRQGVQAARVYTSKDVGAGYKVDYFPIDFIGYRYVNSDKNNDNTQEIVDMYLYPYLIKNGMDKEHLIEQARKMNFMTYCDGTKTYAKIEKKLIDYLMRDGLNKIDAKNIIANLRLVAIGTRIDMRKLECTGISIVDANDPDISTKLTDSVQDIMLNRNLRRLFGNFSDRTGYYYYDGTGEHEFSEYFRLGAHIRPIIHYVVTKFLETSINNENITIREITEGIKQFLKNSGTDEQLIQIIDDNLNYHNAPKYFQEELELRQKVDKIYDIVISQEEKTSKTMR